MKINNSYWSGYVLILLSALMIMLFIVHPVAAGGPSLITVDDDGGMDYTTIVDAVDNASAGDTVLVYPGNYSGRVNVTKQLNITSTGGPRGTHVTFSGPQDYIFYVTADGVIINGFNLSGATGNYDASIYLRDSNGHFITNNTISNNYYGFLAYNSSDSVILNNTIFNNDESACELKDACNISIINNTLFNNDYGAFLDTSCNNTFMNNTILDNDEGIKLTDDSINNTLVNNSVSNSSVYGIYLANSGSNILRSNSMFNNTYNFGLSGSDAELMHDIDTSNTLDGRPFYYLVGQQDVVFGPSSNAGSIYCINCENITVSNMNFSHNGAGVFLFKTNNSTIENNNMSPSIKYGVYNYNCNDNSLMNNVASGSYGFYIRSSYDCNIIRNSALNSESYGFYVTSSAYNNTFANNIASNVIKYGFYIKSASHDNTFENSTVLNAGSYGLYLYSSLNNSFINNTVSNASSYGFYIRSSSGNILENNSILNNTQRGIYLYSSSDNNVLTNNVVRGSEYGLYVKTSDDNNISNNNISLNVQDCGLYLYSSDGNNITDNLILSNKAGIGLSSSDSNTLMDNVILNNSNKGIYLESSSSGNTLKNNSGSNNTIGISLDSSDSNVLMDNFQSNNNDGICLLDSDSNVLKNNELESNRYGLNLSDSNDTIVYNNLFNSTNANVYFAGINSRTVWNITKTAGTNIAGGPSLGGNYWLNTNGTGFSQVNDTDTNRDGFCDGAYTIRSGDVDHLPLRFMDLIRPSVIDVSSVTANGSYKAGDVINISVTFNESVIVTGTPWLTLETGTIDRMANYSSGSPGTTLYFLYTIREGDNSSAFDYTGTNALSLNGGSINDSANNTAILTLASPGAAHSLGANTALVIDTDKPAAVSAPLVSSNGSTWINWTWTNPTDPDFNFTMVYLNGTFLANVTGNFYNTTNLSDGTVYELQLCTVDSAGNINSSWVNLSSSTQNTLPPSSVSTPSASSNGSTWINWTWTNPTDPDFNFTMVYLNGTFLANVTDNFYNTTNLSDGTVYELQLCTVDSAGNINSSWVNLSSSTQNTLPPSAVSTPSVCSNGSTWINWTWTNPTDPDFNFTMVYLNGTFLANVTGNFYNTTNLSDGTVYELQLRTVDSAGNINSSWVNLSSSTQNTLPPCAASTPSASSSGPTWIKWSWTNPADQDFNYTMVYLNGVFVGNFSGSSYTASGLSSSTSYCISLRTVDNAGNINTTWMNTTASTGAASSSGSRTSVGQSMPVQDVVSTASGVKKVLAGSRVEYDLSAGQGCVYEIGFEAKSNEGNVFTSVQVLNGLPADVNEGPSGSDTYEVMSITVGSEGTISDSNAEDILIKFKVSREWIRENNIDPATIRLTRYHDDYWTDLPTGQVGEDEEFLYFTAQTTGFSIFKVMGDKIIEEEGPEVEPEVIPEVVEEKPVQEEEQSGLPVFLILGIIGLLVLAGVFYRMKK